MKNTLISRSVFSMYLTLILKMHSELHSVLCNVFLRVRAANCGCVCVHGPIPGEMAARQLRGHCPLRSAFAFQHQRSVRIFSVENGYFK